LFGQETFDNHEGERDGLNGQEYDEAFLDVLAAGGLELLRHLCVIQAEGHEVEVWIAQLW